MSSRLECKNLTKDYGNVMALSDVNLTLESGRIVGLLGPNGSGKTTLIKLANGLLQPTSGEILLNGLKPGPETKAFVSYLPDANYLAGDTGECNCSCSQRPDLYTIDHDTDDRDGCYDPSAIL